VWVGERPLAEASVGFAKHAPFGSPAPATRMALIDHGGGGPTGPGIAPVVAPPARKRTNWPLWAGGAAFICAIINLAVIVERNVAARELPRWRGLAHFRMIPSAQPRPASLHWNTRGQWYRVGGAKPTTAGFFVNYA